MQLRQRALRKEDEELVATQAHRQVGAADDFIQTGGKFLQYLVTGGMAVGVVDLLETVQVQREHGQRVSLALRASHFGGQALLRKAPVIQASQWINHGEITEKVRMALLLGELAAKPLDENCLRNRIDVKKHDQGDQTKNNIDDADLEDGLRTAPHCRKTKSDNGKSEEKNNKNRVTPHPPIALLNFLKFARQLLISGLYRSRDRMYAGVRHGVETRGTTRPI